MDFNFPSTISLILAPSRVLGYNFLSREKCFDTISRTLQYIQYSIGYASVRDDACRYYNAYFIDELNARQNLVMHDAKQLEL